MASDLHDGLGVYVVGRYDEQTAVLQPVGQFASLDEALGAAFATSA